jgi:aryl-alcohol dehydrogenase-like predicted oxidoreductase
MQWDTANVYSNGVSEQIIGKAIKKYNIPRHKLVILTKCFGVVSEHDTVLTLEYKPQFAKSKDYVNQFGPSISLLPY